MKWKCESCKAEFKAESSYINWRSGMRTHPKCPKCNSYVVKSFI